MTTPLPSISTASDESGVVCITIDVAPVNALPLAVWGHLESAICEAAASPSTRSIVLVGDERKFCAGADIKELTQPTDDPTASLRSVSMTAQAIRTATVPVVAAIGGPAHGGGLELALACDIRIAGPNASFAAAGVNMGLIASAGSLSRTVGDAAARRLLLTGERVGVQRAFELGIISEIASEGEVKERGLELGRLLAMKPPLALASAKNALNQVAALTPDEHDDLVGEAFRTLSTSNDHAEAISAFTEKRPGTFTGT